MGFLIGLLTVAMVLDCLILVFLVLLQLPKKDAGAGLAFGGAATDALFGAGSGTVLTKITRYAATIFFVLALVLSVMQSQYHTRRTSAFESSLKNPGSTAPVAAPAAPPSSPATVPSTTPASTNVPLISTPNVESTNIPAPAAAPPAATTPATGTNPAAPPK